MSKKHFRLQAHQIRDLAKGYGGCIASDRITVDGRKVGYMYRIEPKDDVDSGWRFFARDEDQEYMDNPDHLDMYEVNTIANYDPEIIPLLRSPVGSAFGREHPTANLAPVEGPPPEELPVCRLTEEWSLRLGPAFKRRMEDDSLVFVAARRTIWCSVWQPKEGESAEERLRWIKEEANPNPVERYEPGDPVLKRFAYLLMESDDQRGARWALYATTVSPEGGHLWLAFYVDDREDLAWARKTWDSVEFNPRRK